MDLAINQNLEKSEVYDEGNDEGRSHQDILNELYQNMRGWQSCLGPILVIVSVFLIYIIKYIYTYTYVHIYVTIPEKHDNIPLHMKIYLYIYILIFIDIFSYMQMGTCIFICNYKYLSLYMYIYIVISILQVWRGLADQDQADQHHHTWAYSLACSSPDEWQVQCLGLDSIFFVLGWVWFKDRFG